MSNFFNSNVKSFVLRSGRITSAQKKHFVTIRFFCISFSKKSYCPKKSFGNSNPFVLDIGFGMGDEIIDFAIKNPKKRFRNRNVQAHR